MFDRYIVCEDSLRRRPDGRPGGVVQVRMPYYRGLVLSMVEAVDLTLDGTPIPADRTSFTVHGNTYSFAELPTTVDDRWEMGEPADLEFETEQPVEPGDHEVAVAVRLRVSYMPVPSGGRDTKTLTLSA